jgi:Tol biopolymer transport system component
VAVDVPVLLRIDLKGTTTRLLSLNIRRPCVSPAGDSLAVTLRPKPDRMEREIWIIDLATGAKRQLTRNGMVNSMPMWSRDGKTIFWGSNAYGSDVDRCVLNVYSQGADGSGEPIRLTRGVTHEVPTSVSPDGTILLFDQGAPDKPFPRTIMCLSLGGSGEPEPWRPLKEGKSWGVFSADGHWVAHNVRVSGRPEVRVSPFAGEDLVHLVSPGGGEAPLWTRNGARLFFRNDDRLFYSDVCCSPGFTSGPPTLAFDGECPMYYDVMPDGQSVLVTSFPK